MKKAFGFVSKEILFGIVLVLILLAFAVPNYLRIKMKFNMELVEQNLNVIGEQMKEFEKANSSFPENISRLGQSRPERIIHSALDAIENQKSYHIEAYQTPKTRSAYLLRACPAHGKWGFSGDRCYILDQNGLRPINPWDGTGITMNLFAKNIQEEPDLASNFSGVLTEFMKSAKLSDLEKTDLLANQFEQTAYRLDFKRRQIESGACPAEEKKESCAKVKLNDGPISTIFYVPRSLNSKYHSLIPEIYQRLKKKGVYLFQRDITPAEMTQNNKNTQWNFEGEAPTSYLENRPELKGIEVGFLLKNHVDSNEKLRRKLKNTGRTIEDWLFY